MTTIIICIVIVLIILFSKSSNKDLIEGATFGNISDHVGIFNYGISLRGGLAATRLIDATKGTLIIGPSGSGKTVSVLSASINTLARGGSSMCVMDVSSELYNLWSGYLAKKGYQIYKLDFTSHSDGFNCIELCSTVSELQQASQILIKGGGVEAKNDPYWSTSAEMLLSIFLQYIRFHTEPQHRSMANVIRLIELFAADPKRIDLLMIRTKDEQLISSYKALVATPLKTLHSVISTTIAALKVFKNENVARCTAINTIPFSNFRSEKSALFICIPLPQLSFYSPVASLVFQTLFNEILQRIPEKNELAIALLLDELPVLTCQHIGQFWANCRKYKGIAVGVVQHEKMLELHNSAVEAVAIKSNSHCKIYLKGQSLDTSKHLEELLGECTVKTEKGERRKPLMSASEIRQSDEAIIIIGNSLPLKEKMIPYHEHFVLQSRSRIPPYTCEPRIPFDSPPLLPL